jgi:hypothetical protein
MASLPRAATAWIWDAAAHLHGQMHERSCARSPGRQGRPRVKRLFDPRRVARGSQYAVSMEPTSAGELVKVASGGPELDGILFDTPSRSKVVVAVMDPGRGPVFRTVHPKALTERTEEGPVGRRHPFAARVATGWPPGGEAPVTRVGRCTARPVSSAVQHTTNG